MASVINANTSSGVTTTADTSGVLQFQTASVTAVTIDASQNVGIGTSSPATRLHVNGTGTEILALSKSGGVNAYLQPVSNTDAGLQVKDSAGVINLTVGTTGKTVALKDGVVSTGTGITFPATQSASSDANTLDDYEEGTFTPTLVSTGGGAPAYTVQTGRYYKIGGVVYLFGTVTILGVLPSGNYTRIQGLPFGQTSAQSGVALKYSGATGVSSGQFITAAIGGGEISFARNDGNGEIGVVGLNASFISTTFSATFSTMYQAS